VRYFLAHCIAGSLLKKTDLGTDTLPDSVSEAVMNTLDTIATGLLNDGTNLLSIYFNILSFEYDN